MRLTRLVSACALAATLAACGTQPKVSVHGGEDRALKAPPFVIKGATDFDQRWIDETTEAGIAALGWPRPDPRPPEWDKPLARRDAVAETPAPAAPAVKKKRRWLDRFRKPAVS